ncbi:NUDIX domain-containing protein [Roseibium sp.]|uniref:NUDIX hydrolase n=2 Tax=Roseibium sp. TaxID=1936156 RepID=UPI003265D4E0
MDLMTLSAGAGERHWHGPRSGRPLRSSGKRQMQKIGAFLGGERLRPDLVLTDGSFRAQISAEKALKAAGWTARGISTSEDLAAGRLPARDALKRPLLVALPGTVRQLLGDPAFGLSQGRVEELGPGCLLRLAGQDGRFRLIARTDAGDLPDLFPYPAPDGAGRRDRPAYYYRQSAVIPVRHTPEGTQILIVGSASGRHWTVPKGIVDPGLSPAASARIEAREEAGIKGRVGKHPLGHFSYEKWGAICQVTVFIMEVTKVLEGADWEESHRQRRWVSAPQAADLLRLEALREMVAGL